LNNLRALLISASLVLAIFLPQGAAAHPHVFIDNRLVFLYADGMITGFRTEWRFDEIFTADMLAQYDADGDGQFSEDESKEVADGTLPNLASFHYFTYTKVAGEDLGTLAPSAFRADVVDGAVRFALTFALPQPIDPHRQALAVSVYDSEYYVEVLLAASEPVGREGDGAESCRAEVADDPEHAYYGGFVISQIVRVTCS
jgi:ABC-type uncharacterized transport system substrate-binding protein